MGNKTAIQVAEEHNAARAAEKAKAAKDPDKDPVTKDPDADPSPADKKPLDSPEAKAALVKAEKQAELDKTILETPEDKLTDDMKARKVELAKLSEKSEKKSGAEKRIDELVGKIKALEDQAKTSAADKARITALEAEIKGLQEKATKPDPKKQTDELVNREKERITKYLAEDKDLPREERREMSKDELESWFIEDPTAAQEWITTKVLRRDRERRADMAALSNDNKATDIIKAQRISQAKVVAKHPDLDVQGRFVQLKAEGKTPQEAQVIMSKENPSGYAKAQVIAEIIKEDEDKYLLAPNGPELLMEEMERRLAKAKPGKKPGESDEDRDARLLEEGAAREAERQASIDNPLKTSNGKKPAEKETDTYKHGLNLYLKATKGKKTKADYDAILERRKGIPGAYQD